MLFVVSTIEKFRYNHYITALESNGNEMQKFDDRNNQKKENKDDIRNRIKLLVIDETFEKNSFDFINKICVINRIPLLISDSLRIRINMTKYYFPVNLTPVMYINFDFESIIITYSNRDENENKILTKLMSYENSALNKIFDNFREFLTKLRTQKANKFITLTDRINTKENNNRNGKEAFKIDFNSITSEDVLIELDSAFNGIFKDCFISNIKIIAFLNKLDSITEKFKIEYDPENNKMQLEKYMFPVLKFDEEEKKIYIDQLSINLNYQAYEKAKSKNKIIIKSYEIEHIIHIINTFSKSLTTILNFNFYSILRDMKEKNIEMPYVIVIILILLY